VSQQPTSRQDAAPGETPVQNASTSGSEMGEPGTDGEFASAAVPASPRADAGTPPDAAPDAPSGGPGFGTPPGPPGGAAGSGPGFGTPPGPPGGPAGGGPGFGTPPGPAGGPAGGGPGFGSAAGPGGFRQAPSSGTGGGQAGGVADSERARGALNRLRAEIGKVVVGQDPAVTGLVIALLCQGHVLLEGVPGVAKTLMVRALSAALALDTKRLQFTPDLMPGDVTGSLVYDARTAEFSFRPGPVFTNLLLADEINRTPPKTQASLLEAMEERQVSVEGVPRPLPDPFVVVATQNPIEYEGTYPLPEAQLDRFLLKLTVPLPSRDEEFRVLNNHHRGFDPRDLAAAGMTAVADTGDLAAGRAAVRGVQAAAEVLAYVVDLCRATRQSPSLSLGASPRGATALLSTAKAWAWLSGRDYVTPDDVKALARPTLRHRVAVRPEAELEGVTADGVLDTVLASVPAPR
jgi:MoxR-like ATPase